MTRRHAFVTQSVWAIGGQAVVALLTLAGTRLVTQFLHPSVYGAANLAQNAVLLLRNLSCSPLFSAVSRYYPEADLGDFRDDFRRHVTRRVGVALVAMVAVILGVWAAFGRRLEMSALLTTGLLVYAFADVARTLEMTLLGAARRQRATALLTMLENLVRPLCIVAATIAFGPSVSWTLCAMAASICVTLVPLLWMMRARVRHRELPMPSNVADEIGRFALPLVPVAALTWVMSLSDRYIIEWITRDAEATGVYAAGYGLTSAPLMMVNGVVLMLLRPVCFAAISRGEHDRASRVLRYWLLATGGACTLLAGLLAVLAEPAVHLLLGPKYRGAAQLVPWIAAGYVLYPVEQVLEQWMLAQKRSHAVLKTQLAGAVASVLVTIPLVARFGMPGAAYACPVYFALQALVAAMLVRPARRPSGRSPD